VKAQQNFAHFDKFAYGATGNSLFFQRFHLYVIIG
jgi:hypothetical protein